MRRIMYGLVCGAILVGPLVVGGQAPSTGDKKPREKQTNIEILMQRKQKLAHEVLDALILKDFRRITKNASVLVALSKDAAFQVHRTPLYAQFTEDFQAAAEKLGKNARDKNSDGTTRAFTDLVHCCIACHDYIRARHNKE